MVKRTVPAAFSASELFDLGVELGSTGSLVYFDRRPLRFDGTIAKLELKLNGIGI
jgi:arylsulfatase